MSSIRTLLPRVCRTPLKRSSSKDVDIYNRQAKNSGKTSAEKQATGSKRKSKPCEKQKGPNKKTKKGKAKLVKSKSMNIEGIDKDSNPINRTNYDKSPNFAKSSNEDKAPSLDKRTIRHGSLNGGKPSNALTLKESTITPTSTKHSRGPYAYLPSYGTGELDEYGNPPYTRRYGSYNPNMSSHRKKITKIFSKKSNEFGMKIEVHIEGTISGQREWIEFYDLQWFENGYLIFSEWVNSKANKRAQNFFKHQQSRGHQFYTYVMEVLYRLEQEGKKVS